MKHYSTQPRKQRLFSYNRNAHDRSRAMSAHLSDELLKEYSRIRSLTVRKGDTVKVVRGAFKGQVAKVIRVFPRKGMISIEEATLTKADNKKVARLFRPSKVILTKLDLSDPWRREKLQRGKPSPAEEKREERAEKAAEKEAKEERAAEMELREAEKAEKAADREEKAAERAEKAADRAEKAAVKHLKEEETAEKAAGKAEAPREKKPEHREAPKADHPAAHKPEHKQSHSKEESK
jgi:large subunit ribosomal protein L24